MATIIGDYIGSTIGIHSPFPAKHQTEVLGGSAGGLGSTVRRCLSQVVAPS